MSGKKKTRMREQKGDFELSAGSGQTFDERQVDGCQRQAPVTSIGNNKFWIPV